MAERLDLIGTDVAGYIFNRAPRQAVLSVNGATMPQRLHPASRLDWRGALLPSGHRTGTSVPPQPPPEE
jgi:hypothetical protein